LTKLALLLLAGCAAAPTQTVSLVVTLDSGTTRVADASFDSSPTAAIVDASPRDAAKPTASEPWCNDKYDNTPCIFHAYGGCYVRDRQPPPRDDTYAYSYCPAAPMPSFMAHARSCGRKQNEPIVQKPASYVRAPDLARCSAIETKWANVPHEDRACTSDADCAKVVDGCFIKVLNKKAQALPKYADQPCPNPAAGMCSPSNDPVRCASGCCILEGSSPFGTIDTAYPKVTPP
jgi:hypothetical protein